MRIGYSREWPSVWAVPNSERTKAGADVSLATLPLSIEQVGEESDGAAGLRTLFTVLINSVGEKGLFRNVHPSIKGTRDSSCPDIRITLTPGRTACNRTASSGPLSPGICISRLLQCSLHYGETTKLWLKLRRNDGSIRGRSPLRDHTLR